MSTPPQTVEMARPKSEIFPLGGLRLWSQFSLTQQKQLAQHWGRLMQRLRNTPSRPPREG